MTEFESATLSAEEKIAEKGLPVDEVYTPSPEVMRGCYVYSDKMYNDMYQRSLNDPDAFWTEMSRTIDWMRPFDTVHYEDFKTGDVRWFLNGKLNATVNCVDRWAATYPSRPAILWEGDEPGTDRVITYKQLLDNVCRMSNMLLSLGVKKGDRVTIYMPMIPELPMMMLACARIGALHSVVFAGFSAPSLRDRINDAQSAVVVCADIGVRGGKKILIKDICDEAVQEVRPGLVQSVVVFKHYSKPGMEGKWDPSRDVDGFELMAAQRPYCPPVEMDSEDLLFMLYTSGSTGTPKGIAHSIGGYLVYTTITLKYVFDVHPGDVWACVADCGWITGHSYIVYGPLANGASVVLFEGIPTYPNNSRYWDLIQKYKINQFYTAPTAIRALMRFGATPLEGYDLSSLRVLGSVGEPINPEAWRWYYNEVGKGKVPIMDTYWQTETGGIMLTPMPYRALKPGSATKPFFGIEPALLDPMTGKEVEGNSVHGLLAIKRSWPSMIRTVYGDHSRMTQLYLEPYPGYYFTGDGAVRDHDGYYWITGRIDDVMNVSGHRLGSAEIEHALVQSTAVSEAAVVGCSHPVKGEGIFCYVILNEGFHESEDLIRELKNEVRKSIGPIATPDVILCVPGLPKTRSGKIMRRILRKVANRIYNDMGDTSTLAEPEVVEAIVMRARAHHGEDMRKGTFSTHLQ
ncbi:acetyl-coenzyme A synthetase, putative [Perkinsus marinus ATCC 50983]|uniref:Acetyl-coenzyme A synthetase n=2 Tax=Perkinsus marinus (strain ATCC 50983 / TXsc) TaxID=423536 RepID=C5KRG3_PERM5|nr:acetyl-coenzyme A synthetase, putative [Perkinsus marinus ATCC 50983]EER12936.1 acetyl-coenzyme A synthetase, putative [Perkinsus marinus ATCC 50983]|eukprot:XP_002781141.1 acetyl-coenzyme A synthetase, putative [Perkinsus marinus ATCC 50983]